MELTASVVYDFPDQTDGCYVVPGLAFDAERNLYGATTGEADEASGGVFQLAPGTNGMWTISVDFSFVSLNDGYYPGQGPILDSHGDLYGTTELGGRGGFGVVYKASQKNGIWTENILHAFTNGNDGSEPLGALLIGKGGNLYGTTAGGGKSNCDGGCGTVFRVSP